MRSRAFLFTESPLQSPSVNANRSLELGIFNSGFSGLGSGGADGRGKSERVFHVAAVPEVQK
jgi:hypothetical protein